MRALSKDKNQRQQSVREFYEEFTMGGGRTTGIGLARPSGADIVVPSSGAIAAGGGLTGAMTSARTQPGNAVLTPPPGSVNQFSAPGGYPSSPGMPQPVIGGVPTGSGQVFQAPPPAKKSSLPAILGGVAAVAVVGVAAAFFLTRGNGDHHAGGPDGVDAGPATSVSTVTATPPPDTGKQAEVDASVAETAAPVDAGPPAVPTGPMQPIKPVGPSLESERACREAEARANHDELGPARAAFARCEGPGKVTARMAIEQATIRHGRKHPRCPPGKRCPRGK